jgi:hypothetical protein
VIELPPEPEPEPEPPPPPPVIVLPPEPVELPPPPADGAPIANYETFLSSIKAVFNSMLPQRDSLETLKKAIITQTPAPKDEYESSTAYETRIADFEKNKQVKIDSLEAAFSAKNKPVIEKLKTNILDKKDYQPDWGGFLTKNADIDGYRERMGKFKNKASQMSVKIGEINSQLANLDFGKESERVQGAFAAKNTLYISRLERAQELMRDYIIQEQTRVLTTEKHKPEMTLGNYNADGEEFEISMKGSGSADVPFSYSGLMKISAERAREMNRSTADLTAAIDYINYPFVTQGQRLWPGVKAPHIFYKDQEIPVSGSFKSVEELVSMPGYIEWAIYADSLLSGTLVPNKWDSTHAIGGAPVLPPPPPAPPYLTILRVTTFAIAAASAGLGYFKFNNDVKTKGNKANESLKEMGKIMEANGYSAEEYTKDGNYKLFYDDYNDNIDKAKSSETWRNILYGGAGVFCVAAGILTFAF